MLLSQLTDDQKSHLAWRLDHNTSCGYVTAGAVARGDHGDMEVVDIFVKYGDRSIRSAKALARKVETFVCDPVVKAKMEVKIALFLPIMNLIRKHCDAANLESHDMAEVMEHVGEHLQSSASMYRI